MAKINGVPNISARITIELSEAEAAALDALVGYGVDSFLDVFYTKLGRAYLQPHEHGLRSLFTSVRNGEASVALFLQRIKDARKVFEGKAVNG